MTWLLKPCCCSLLSRILLSLFFHRCIAKQTQQSPVPLAVPTAWGPRASAREGRPETDSSPSRPASTQPLLRSRSPTAAVPWAKAGSTPQDNAHLKVLRTSHAPTKIQTQTLSHTHSLTHARIRACSVCACVWMCLYAHTLGRCASGMLCV
jgi:hypothetical protein